MTTNRVSGRVITRPVIFDPSDAALPPLPSKLSKAVTHVTVDNVSEDSDMESTNGFEDSGSFCHANANDHNTQRIAFKESLSLKVTILCKLIIHA